MSYRIRVRFCTGDTRFVSPLPGQDKFAAVAQAYVSMVRQMLLTAERDDLDEHITWVGVEALNKYQDFRLVCSTGDIIHQRNHHWEVKGG